MYLKRIQDGNNREYYVIHKERILAIFVRAAILIITEFVVIQSFTFVDKSGVNPGVMSIIFSSSIVFTPMLFYCKFGQKLRRVDYIGAVLVAICVALIGLGGASASQSIED